MWQIYLSTPISAFKFFSLSHFTPSPPPALKFRERKRSTPLFLHTLFSWVTGKLRTMAVTMKQMALLVAFLGALSFILGVVAENKKPPHGTPITGKGVVICKYPSDPSVALGYASFAFLVVCMVAGWYSLFYPYKGKHVPKAALFQNKGFLAFFGVAL
ncbi:hypothetical protein AAHA92_32347 [Salvia divinorum]|uniref:Uncharacterized protein n=1 Tax=Salvia divinorum TaxID=28513 RepID=A0ABD1FNP0_SALDI